MNNFTEPSRRDFLKTAMASGLLLAVSEANTARHTDNALTWGDVVWASWAPEAPVVLTH